MNLDIDVSGEDIFKKNYSICVANKDIIIGFKFKEPLIRIITSTYGQELYRYRKSKKQRALLKVRIYSIIVYYLLKSINAKKYNLTVCRDFSGNENTIKDNLNYFIRDKLNKPLDIQFRTLESDSNAHHYAYQMRNDLANKLSIYHDITLKQIEQYLKK